MKEMVIKEEDGDAEDNLWFLISSTCSDKSNIEWLLYELVQPNSIIFCYPNSIIFCYDVENGQIARIIK